MKNKGYANFFFGGGGGRIRCVMGNVEVAYYHWAVPQAAHAIIGDLSMYTTQT